MALYQGHSINAAPNDHDDEATPLLEKAPETAVPPQCCSARFNLATLMFFGFAVVYGLRVNLSVAMVAMVNSTGVLPFTNHSAAQGCPAPPSANNSGGAALPDGIPQYPWDSDTQGYLLGAFFFGYLLTQIPGGYLSGHLGGRVFLGVGVVSTAVLTLLTPLAAELGVHWLFALRVLEGVGEVRAAAAGCRRACNMEATAVFRMCSKLYPLLSCVHVHQGVTYPAMMAMWACWAPPQERSRLMTFSGGGGNFGAFVALPLTGLICHMLGWPAVFYCFGGAGCLWGLFWFTCVSNDPRSHPRISEHERDYIISSIGSQGAAHGWSVPLLPMVLSVPLWAIILSQMCSNWAYYTLLTSLPTYMDTVLHFDLSQNGFLSALPYLGAWLGAVMSGILADHLLERKLLSITAVRKILTLTGLLLPALCLVAVGFVGCSGVLAVTFLTLSTTLGGSSAAGVFINQIDIAPRYAGMLLGITNTFGTVPGALAPIVMGYLTRDHSVIGWRNVFCLSAGVSACGAFIFTLFGSGKIQDWALRDEDIETETGRGQPDRQVYGHT